MMTGQRIPRICTTIILASALLFSAEPASARENDALEAIRSLIRVGQPRAALEELNKNNGSPRHAGLKALALARTMQLENAAEVARQALATEPQQQEANLALAEICIGSGKLEQALGYARQAQTGYWAGEALLVEADIHVIQGNAPAAAEAIREALPLIDWMPEERRNNIAGLAGFLDDVGDTALYQITGGAKADIDADIQRTKVHIPVSANGQEFRFVIDTGNAGMVAVTSELADRLGVERKGTVRARGADTHFDVELGMLETFSIGSMTFRNVPVMITSNVRASRDGNIGRHILMHMNMSINYGAGTVTMAGLGTSVSPEHPPSLQVPFSYWPIMQVSANIGEHSPAPFIFDTGSPRFMVDDAYWRAIELQPMQSGPPMMARGAGGETVEITPLQPQPLMLGGRMVQPSMVLGMDFSDIKSARNGAYEGVIGVDIVGDGILEINMDRAMLFLYLEEQQAAAPEVDTAVTELIRVIERVYPLKEKIPAIIQHLRQRHESGAYDHIQSNDELASMLTSDMFAASNDRHMRVQVLRPDSDSGGPRVVRVAPGEKKAGNGPRVAGRRPAVSERANEGRRVVRRMPEDGAESEEGPRMQPKPRMATVEGCRMLEGNIGLIDIGMFNPWNPEVKEEIDQAFATVADADGLIVDLRHMPGGFPETIAYFAGYLFDDQARLLVKYHASDGSVDPLYTVTDVTGRRMPDVPLVFLVNGRTASGGEAITWMLKQYDRVHVIGSTTAGAGLLGGTYPLTEGLQAFISTYRPEYPKTGFDGFEGTGISPDEEATGEAGLTKAIDWMQTQWQQKQDFQ